jgi:hypothetical protein
MGKRGKIIPFPGPRRAAAPPSRDDGLVEAHRCHPAEALVVKSLFESEGIPTLLRSNLVTSLHPFSVGDQGQVAVLVPESQLARSRVLLIRVVRGSAPS